MIGVKSNDLALLRLMHLVSPSLPVGSFTYSQGIEWAVECGWISTADELESWLENLLHSGVTYLEVPLLHRMYQSVEQQNKDELCYWIDYLNASRETAELLQEEKNRGRAFADLLIALDVPLAAKWKPLLAQNQSAALHWRPCSGRYR